MRSLEADAIEILRAVRIAFHSLLSPYELGSARRVKINFVHFINWD